MKIVEDFRTGSADIVLAAKSVETQNKWTVMGSPSEVRLQSLAELLITRGQPVIRYEISLENSSLECCQ